jgi:hypothetical protein
MGETRNAYKILVGNIKLIDTLEDPDIDIRTDFKETVFVGVDWIRMAHERGK